MTLKNLDLEIFYSDTLSLIMGKIYLNLPIIHYLLSAIRFREEISAFHITFFNVINNCILMDTVIKNTKIKHVYTETNYSTYINYTNLIIELSHRETQET